MGVVPVRVEDRATGAGRDVLQDEILQRGTFAGAGAADDKEMLKAPLVGNFERRKIFLDADADRIVGCVLAAFKAAPYRDEHPKAKCLVLEEFAR